MRLVPVAKVAVVLAFSLMGAKAFADDLVAAVLPLSRSPAVGQTATAFATVINTSGRDLTGCNVTLPGFTGTFFLYRTTNPATNAIVGGANQPFNLAAGASQTLLIALQQATVLPPTDEHLVFQCTGSLPAASVIGVNTLLLAVGASATPDVVALGATPTADGTLKTNGVGAAGAFAVASVNVGSAGNITVTADTGDIQLPISVSLCQTNPTTGVCTNPASPASSVNLSIGANATPTFSIFVTANAPIPFFPATTRLFIRFKDGAGVTRGSTSVALNSNSTLAAGQTVGGYFTGISRTTSGMDVGGSNNIEFIIAENGMLAGTNSDRSSVFIANASTPTASLLYSATGYIDDDVGYAPLTVNGAISPRSLIAGLYSRTGTNSAGQFYATYNAGRYERASSLGTVAGTWNIREADGTKIGTATISANGAITGSAPGASAGCTITGSVATINTSYNAYSVTVTPANCGGNLPQSGLGSMYDTNAPNDSFQLILANTSGNTIAVSFTKF
jgi:hypothetical protein